MINPHYIDIMKDLYFEIKAGNKYRDVEELYRELSEEFAELGESNISKSLKEEYELEVDRKRRANRDSLLKSIEKLEKKIQINFGRKIYPNELCPCGSGKKYKKCCGGKQNGGAHEKTTGMLHL